MKQNGKETVKNNAYWEEKPKAKTMKTDVKPLKNNAKHKKRLVKEK